jgi:hypothetical protein
MPHNKKFEEQALLYAYGELDDSKEAAFLEHLRECKACQNIIKITALTSAALPEHQAPVLDLQSFFEESWLLKAKNWFSKINLSRPVLLGGAAACCVAVLVSIFYPRQTQSEGYMYFSDSIYTQVDDIETDIDTLLEDINSYL